MSKKELRVEKVKTPHAYYHWRTEEKNITKDFDVPAQWYVPVCVCGKLTMELEPRPERKFKKGERESISFAFAREIERSVFGQPQYILSPKGEIFRNPQWDEQETLEDDEIIVS